MTKTNRRQYELIRMSAEMLLAIALWVNVATAVPPDSGMVRIRGNLNGATITIDDDQPFLRDSYGNPPADDTWFMLRVAAGTHLITISSTDDRAFQKTVTVGPNDVYTIEAVSFDVLGPPSPSDETIQPAGAAFRTLLVRSDPNGAQIRLNGRFEFTSPAEIFTSSGVQKLDVGKDGFEPISYELSDSAGSDIRLLFVLRATQPVPLAPEELGLIRQPTQVPRDEAEADMLRKRYNGLAEMFAIVPLGQGMMARLVVGEDEKQEAELLILSGVGLTAGSYLLGSVLSKRKRKKIRSENILIEQQNAAAQEHNRQIEIQTRQLNADAMREWQVRNQNRGRVEILNNNAE